MLLGHKGPRRRDIPNPDTYARRLVLIVVLDRERPGCPAISVGMSGIWMLMWGIFQKYPQYCWEFHDRLWEALSGTTSEKRGVPSRTGGERLLEMLWKPSNALNYRVWGIPPVLSTGIPGNALRAFPGCFRNFSRISSGKCQPYWGYGPIFRERKTHKHKQGAGLCRDRSKPRGPCETDWGVSRQKLTPHCLEAIFDSQLPSPKLSPKMPPKLSLPHKRGLFILFQNEPRGEGNCETSERQKLSRGNFCPATSVCLFWPTG